MATLSISFLHPVSRIDTTTTTPSAQMRIYNFIDHLFSSPFASSCYQVLEAPSSIGKRHFVVLDTNKPLPLGRAGHILAKIIFVSSFYFNWKIASFTALAGLMIKSYVRLTEYYSNPASKQPTEDPAEANISKWQRKVQCKLLYHCFVLGNTEIHAIDSMTQEPAQTVWVFIGEKGHSYPITFLKKIPFIYTLLQRWTTAATDDIRLSSVFPVSHTELKRLLELHKKSAALPMNAETDFLCLDTDAFARAAPDDSAARIRMVQNEAFRDCKFMNFYFPQSVPGNFKQNPPVNKVPPCAFDLLPVIDSVERANESDDTETRRRAVVGFLNGLHNQPRTHRCYYSNKVINEFITSLNDDLNGRPNSFDPWVELKAVFDQCPDVATFITVLDFPITFEFTESAWIFLDSLTNLLWLQIVALNNFQIPTRTYSSVRVVNMEIPSPEQKEQIVLAFPNADVIEIQ